MGLYGNPRFVAPTTGNLRLLATSPAVDAGTQTLPFAVIDDLSATVSRPKGLARDVGAYEFSP
jgi:hypothetical protein